MFETRELPYAADGIRFAVITPQRIVLEWYGSRKDALNRTRIENMQIGIPRMQ